MFRQGNLSDKIPHSAIRIPQFLLILLLAVTAGCRSPEGKDAKALYTIGRTGQGDGELIYPRALDLAADGTLYVCDKTGRIQHFTAKGEFLDSFYTPEHKMGMPVGITIGPDGNIYVADTHYARVLVMSPQGKVLRQVGDGESGSGDGQFIFPTDVAFVGEGAEMKMLVSEYGGNDRISIFDMSGKFLGQLGSFGEDSGQFSRPSAMAVDNKLNRLYVADSCNHRIAIYDLQFKLVGYIGSAGTAAGQLRYPYGLALTPDGNLAVAEFGNNRLQILSADGKSLGTFGQSGREMGQLVYPWGLAIDAQRRAYVADGGNNRVQVWQL